MTVRECSPTGTVETDFTYPVKDDTTWDTELCLLVSQKLLLSYDWIQQDPVNIPQEIIQTIDIKFA